MSLFVDVVLSPGETLPEVDSWIVIDILRATTTMCAFFDGGGRILFPAASVEEGILLRDRLEMDGKPVCLMGERNALPPPGFDLGNSPLELLAADPSERPVAVMATSNGTRALLRAASSGKPVWAACARNASAVLQKAVKKGNSIGILCAGRLGRTALDDAACAGLLVDTLLREGDAILEDGAHMALSVWKSGNGDLPALLCKSAHGRLLGGLGFGGDLEYASVIDTSQAAPFLAERRGLIAVCPGEEP